MRNGMEFSPQKFEIRSSSVATVMETFGQVLASGPGNIDNIFQNGFSFE
jgi:hypothetical protein